MRRLANWCVIAALTSGLALAGCAEETDVEAEAEGEQVEAPADTVSPEVELEELRREYERAYIERDDPALEALHTKEYLEITPEGEVIETAQIDTVPDDTTATMAGARELSIETESMTVAESGDVAYGTGTTVLRGTGPEGREFTAESRWLAGFRKVDGEWKIDRLMTSTPTEAEMDGSPDATGADTTAAGAGADTTATM